MVENKEVHWDLLWSASVGHLLNQNFVHALGIDDVQEVSNHLPIRMRLRDGLVNFQPVAQGEVLSAPSTPEITAPCDGFLLFPKYPGYQADGSAIEPRPGEIVRIVAPLAQHPLDLWDVSGS